MAGAALALLGGGALGLVPLLPLLVRSVAKNTTPGAVRSILLLPAVLFLFLGPLLLTEQPFAAQTASCLSSVVAFKVREAWRFWSRVKVWCCLPRPARRLHLRPSLPIQIIALAAGRGVLADPSLDSRAFWVVALVPIIPIPGGYEGMRKLKKAGLYARNAIYSSARAAPRPSPRPRARQSPKVPI